MGFINKTLGKKDEGHDELVKKIVRSCFKSTCVVLACIIVFELYFYINCWNHSANFGWTGPWYRSCYLSLLISSVVALGLIIYCRQDYDKRYRIMEWLSPIYSVIITAWALSVTYLDCLKSQKCSPIIIMTILLCIPACIYVNPKFFFILNIIANLIMLSMLKWAPGGGDSADIYNYLVFMIIQIIVSRYFLYTKFSYYRSMQVQMELRLKEEKMSQQKKQAEEMTLLLIRTLSDTIEAKDEYLCGHSSRVSEYTELIARKLGLPEEEVSEIKYAATLHDIGKIGVPDTILNKPSRLTDEEYDIIKNHSLVGADLLENIDVISYTSEIARHHHERYDGKGYPDGLLGEESSLGARIVAVADSFDAMNSRRIYRNPLSREAIREEIVKNKGTQFDPKVADAFLELLDSGAIDELIADKDTHLEITSDDGEIINEEAEKILSAVVSTMKTSGMGDSKDFLTGLKSRGYGETIIAELMKEKPGALIFCDMDNLKTINDRFGHKCGDKALKLLGDVIGKYGEDGVACRVGGDEFLLYLDGADEKKTIEVVENIISDFEKGTSEDVSIEIASLSIGVCLSSINDMYADVLSRADKALYHVKERGKAGYYFYHDGMNSSGSDNHIDINEVRRSIEEAGQYDGALDIEYRQFAKMYEYLNKVCKRYRHTSNIVLVTLDVKPNMTMNIDSIEESMHYMEMAIKNTIRNVDICTRYSSLQFLIVMLEAGEDNIDTIMNRIFSSFYKMNSETGLEPRYEVSSVFEDHDKITI